MFDTIVSPILLLHSCEILGYENNDAIESLYLQFYKIILGVQKVNSELWFIRRTW